jgi:arsenate reductase-like glutaredoxin family protein
LLDRDSRAFREAGLGYLKMDDAAIVDRLLADASLLRLPLVRYGNAVSVGQDEAAWAAWLRSGGDS